MSATNAALSMVRPFSSEKMQSSAKYFFHGSALPGTTASNSSWVQRTSSLSEIASSAVANRVATSPNMPTDVARRRGRIFMLANQGGVDETSTSAWESHVSPRAIVQTENRGTTLLGWFGYAGDLNQAAVGRTVDFLRKSGSTFSTSASAVMPCFFRRMGTAPCSMN